MPSADKKKQSKQKLTAVGLYEEDEEIIAATMAKFHMTASGAIRHLIRVAGPIVLDRT